MQITSNLVDANHPATLVSGVTYAPNGAIKQMLYGNGLTEARYYNDRLQPCRLNINSSASTLSACSGSVPSGSVQDFTYGFNAGTSDNGNVMMWSATGNQVFSRTFAYDSLNRISTMTQSSGNPTTCSSAFGLSWIPGAMPATKTLPRVRAWDSITPPPPRTKSPVRPLRSTP